MKNITGFIHAYAINDWRLMVDTQIYKIKRFGLMDKLDSLYIGIVYHEADGAPNSHFDNYPFLSPEENKKLKVVYCLNHPEYEQSLTLHALWIRCQRTDGYVFYIHTKGVSHILPGRRVFQDDWRNMMEYYIIEKHEECLHYFNATKADIIGTNWHLGDGYMGATPRMCGGLKATPHFSGNFWWARNEYIRKLPEIFPIKKSKYECEFWIGLANPKVLEIWNSGVFHHIHLYPKRMYFNQKAIRFINM